MRRLFESSEANPCQLNLKGPAQYRAACWLHSALVAIFLTEYSKYLIKIIIEPGYILKMANSKCQERNFDQMRSLVENYYYILNLLINAYVTPDNSGQLKCFDPRKRPISLRQASRENAPLTKLRQLDGYSNTRTVIPFLNQLLSCKQNKNFFIKYISVNINFFSNPVDVLSSELGKQRGLIFIDFLFSTNKGKIKRIIFDFVKKQQSFYGWKLGSLTYLKGTHITCLIKCQNKNYYYDNERLSGRFLQIDNWHNYLNRLSWHDFYSVQFYYFKTD